MAKAPPEEVVRPSLLDRLVGEVPKNVPGARLEVGVRELKRSVARDLEWLLNTRVWYPGSLEDWHELSRSVVNYGIPDFSGFSWTSQGDAEKICRALEIAIRRFEPRLAPRSVRVSLQPRSDLAEFRLHFRIDGILHVEPVTEPVSFDTSVEIDTGAMHVDGAV